MKEISLVLPVKEHETKALKMKQEFFDSGETVINGSALLDQFCSMSK